MENGAKPMGPVTLPNGDPGNNGGASYMGTKQTPSTEDFEDLFGPAGRDVKQDPLRNKRNQRWHLPDVLKGTNNFLTDRVDGLISNATDSPFTSAILPYQYVDNPDQAMTWDVWSYDEGLASRVPYESAARVLTQSKTSHSAYIVRQGLAISMEHNFMMSERGRRDFNNQLMQLVGSIQYTNDLDVHMALLTAPNYERTEAEKYAYSESDPYAILRKYVDMHGMCQKNPNGLDILIEDAKQVFKKWGSSDPTFMLCNPKIGYQQNMTIDKTQYVTNGVDGIKRLKAGPDLKTYRGLNVINSRHFSMEAGRQPRDLLNRRVRVAEHYKLPAMTVTDMNERELMLYDEGKDQMVPIPCESLYAAAMLPDEESFKSLLALEKDHATIPRQFWNHFFYNPDDKDQTEFLGRTKFTTWLQTPPTIGSLNAAYHPTFVLYFYAYYYAQKGSVDAGLVAWEDVPWNFDAVMLGPHADCECALIDAAEYVKLMNRIFTHSVEDQIQMAVWLQFTRKERPVVQKHPTTYGNCHNSSKLNTDPNGYFNPRLGRITETVFYMGNWEDGDRQTADDRAASVKVMDDEDNDHAINWDSVAYAQMLPYISDVYSRCHNMKGMFNNGMAVATLRKHTLIAMRPSIEHYMLGVVVGRGGTGELGATLWGQTELSCYDDAMHGKWGMNYKYHARAVVFNEKHLLRLWDVAYNGYTGGMGTKLVKWTDSARGGDDTEIFEKWKQDSVSLDEPVKYDFHDIFVMRFDEDKTFDASVSNPINFYTKDNQPSAAIYSDPENVHNSTHCAAMDVFRTFDQGTNKARYNEYVKLMPNYSSMHAQRKNAGHAATEGDTHVSSLSYSGTMAVNNKITGACIFQQHGTGHCGDSFPGSASVRAGNGTMVTGRPALGRIM